MLWIRDNEPDVWSRTHKFLDVKGYLLYRATGNFVTSPDEANLTWLLDTRRGRAEWDLRLAGRYGIPPEKLPAVKKSVEVAGRLTREAAGELGLVGEGEIHIYVGTSDWVAAHVRERRLDLFHYVGSIHSAIPDAYLLVAEQEVAGAALDKVMELLEVADYGEVERLVSST
jgi:Sugar (pentulose and hexulose) kinases